MTATQQDATDEPLVSIIIPCYNAASTVGAAIDSALAQTYSHIEIIVIDDGSHDESVQVLRSYGYEITWQTGPNRGGGAARNRGLLIARGEMVQFLDADDVLYPQKLEFQVPLLLRAKGNLVYGNSDVTRGTRADGVDACWVPGSNNWRRNVLFDRIQTSAPLHWKSDLDAIGGFRESLPCCQEKDLHIRLAMNGIEFRHVDQSLHLVCRREGSVSSDYLRVLRVLPGVYDYAVEALTERHLLNDAWRVVLAEAYAYIGGQLMQRSEWVLGRSCFRSAEALHPSAGLAVFGRRKQRSIRFLGPTFTYQLQLVRSKWQ